MMKRFLMILVLGLLLSTNAFSKNYKCRILGEEGTVNLVKSRGLYNLIFEDGEQWPFQVYQESTELIVMGEISNEEGEFEQEIEDGLGIILFSKVHNTAKFIAYNNKGEKITEGASLVDCK